MLRRLTTTVRPRPVFSEIELILSDSTNEVAACDRPSGMILSKIDNAFVAPRFSILVFPVRRVSRERLSREVRRAFKEKSSNRNRLADLFRALSIRLRLGP